MTEQELKRLEHAKRQYFLRINDTPVVILVDDCEDGNWVSGCFEYLPEGDSFDLLSGEVTVKLKQIDDQTVLGYAQLTLIGILEQIKKEYGQ